MSKTPETPNLWDIGCGPFVFAFAALFGVWAMVWLAAKLPWPWQ
jgi:hypothetical protein